ncbi:MAG: hypothetical protein L0Z50_31045 [Verrucomicrobiales bacterium]|nr:hypothetical protein [Verrucomicrobiales bacterium]
MLAVWSVLSFCCLGDVLGQALTSEPDFFDPDFTYQLIGWDLTGMTAEEQEALDVISLRRPPITPVQPTPESDLAITDPAAYRARFPESKTAAQLQAESDSAWVITHPVEYAKAMDGLKTSARRAAEQLSLSMMLQPQLFNSMRDSLMTPEQKAAEAKINEQSAIREGKPTPVFKPILKTEFEPKPVETKGE